MLNISTRKSPQHALKVATLRCDAAVTITITGKYGSGKSTIAEYLTEHLAMGGFNAVQLESDDSIYSVPRLTNKGNDDRLVLVQVEDPSLSFDRPEKPEPATEEKECDGDCEDCDGKDIPPILKAILLHALTRASRPDM